MAGAIRAISFSEVLRIVAVRKGKLVPSEFMLRPGELGLSLFAKVKEPRPEQVIEAVRMAGKQGDLRAAVISITRLRSLGLRLVPSIGGTPDADINSLHLEARLPAWRRLAFYVRGIPPHEYFNSQISPKLCEIARVLS